MVKRTLENCTYANLYGHPEVINGKCAGLGKTEEDDETAEVCKICSLYYQADSEN